MFAPQDWIVIKLMILWPFIQRHHQVKISIDFWWIPAKLTAFPSASTRLGVFCVNSQVFCMHVNSDGEHGILFWSEPVQYVEVDVIFLNGFHMLVLCCAASAVYPPWTPPTDTTWQITKHFPYCCILDSVLWEWIGLSYCGFQHCSVR